MSNGLGSKIRLSPPPPGVAVSCSSKSAFTYEELAMATYEFSDANLLGQGGFGFVHKGTLTDGKEVAVKQLKSGSGQGEREFQAEVEIISRVHHRHLVSLVGYCISGDRRLLIYEYVPNGTLEFHLLDHVSLVRDHKIKCQLGDLGVTVKSFNGDMLYEPWEVYDESGRAFTSFSAYWAKCMSLSVESASILPPWKLVPSTDCGKNEPELNKEMGKQFVDLLTKELKMQETVAEEHNHHTNATLVEAKRMASQYQKEVEKCNAATETCEVARERNEAFLAKEKKITAMWERRARQLGWQAK